MVSENALIAISSPYIPIFKPLGALIGCLIEKESGGKVDAVGDEGKAFGILQFWLGTFNHFKEKYKMSWLEYKDPGDQITLAELMLTDGYGFHWTTYKRCI